MPRVNKAKRRVNNFTYLLLIKLRNFPAGVRVINQPLRLFQDSADELPTDFRHSLIEVVSLNILKIIYRRSRDNQLHLCHAEYLPGLIQGDGIARTDISQSLSYGLDEA